MSQWPDSRQGWQSPSLFPGEGFIPVPPGCSPGQPSQSPLWVPSPQMQTAAQLSKELKTDGNFHFKRGAYYSALKCYTQALQICTANGFQTTATELNSNIAAVYLKKQNYQLAFTHANECIRLDQQFGKGYYRRAEAYRLLVSSQTVSTELTSSMLRQAVQDYVQCYKLTQDLDTLCQAAMLAVHKDYTWSSQLQLSKLQLTASNCVKLIKKLLTKEESTALQLKFLLVKIPDCEESGLASSLSGCNLSSISCSLVLKKAGLDAATLQSFLNLGASLTFEDIREAIVNVPDSEVELITVLIDTSTARSLHVQLDVLYMISLHIKKYMFAKQLILKGAIAGSNEARKAIDWESISEELLLLIASRSSASERAELLCETINNDHPNIAEKILSISPIKFDHIDLASLIQSPSATLVSSPQLLKELIDAGISPNGREIQPLDAVLRLPRLSRDGKVTVATLISILCSSEEINLECICVPLENGTTLVHIATELAIETGNTEMLENVCNRFPFPKDGKLHDESQQTPYDIAMKFKGKDLKRSENVCKVLSNYHIKPNLTNQPGRKRKDGKSKDDNRLKILQKAAEKFKTPSKSEEKGKSKKRKGKPKPTEQTTSTSAENKAIQDENTLVPSINVTDDQTLESVLTTILKKDDSYFMSPPEYQKQTSHLCIPKLSKTPNSKIETNYDEDQPAEDSETDDDERQDGSVDSDTVTELSTLQDLAWEVEATEKVVKFFKNKKNPNWLHKFAIQKIKMLAIGDWHSPKICKRLLAAQEIELVLYETRLTKNARILWEVTRQFSSRRTDKPTSSSDKVVHVYSEVIRIWDIVLHHDQLNNCIKHIKKSHERGYSASLKLLLVPDEKDVSSANLGVRLPRQYRLCSDLKEANTDSMQQLPFIPAGCTKEHEHNVITFYSISDPLLESMLKGEDARRDFPIKEWPGEFDIIEMPYDKESILLLGRSGTGKTTCCLYRLWNQFQTYWSKAVTTGPLLARKPPAYYSAFSELACGSSADDTSMDVLEEDKSKGATLVFDTEHQNTACISEDDSASSDEQSSISEIPEHLHLVFVSKNYVLSAQMKTRFYDMAAANPVFESHRLYEGKDLPNRISEIEDFAYPLFLTTRQFFLLLDNSLGNGKTFFPRAKDGSLEVKILSSDYDHENPDTLLDLIEEESDDGDDEIEDDDTQQENDTSKKQECKEVTASFFEKQIWPVILKKTAHNCKEIDPLLVWMEIKSFIKGSRQAVESEKGYLSEEEYKVLGKKMAPNFPGNRSEIYELFNLYQNFLQRERHRYLFDECDFIHSIHTRLKNPGYLDWSIHNFYVDEVQDFTQAELSVLLQVCRHPNGLFLTGDTAQSIMRGVSFRFDDLRSLFFDLNEKTKQSKARVPIKVPFVRQLGINFRSHAQILQLAASIIDLLVNFFPSSFDHLPEDKGMFHGPIPTLLHSCNISDLAVLLRGNKREASSIEFGAHQVIIVQSEDAKKALPDVLTAGNVLTVFEAKGLEFDDVLLYDFFADSKVSKEWRVVTSFIGLTKNAAMIKNQNLPFETQPRPLEFSETQHMSLNSELKYLYTAVTRAKCNLWIYDSDKDKRLPIFDYWHKRGLVKVIQIDDISKDESGLFVTSSTKQEWKEQGDYFKKKRLWEPAKKCYQKAGHPLLEMEAEAYSLVQQAREHKGKEMQDLYLKAALAFLNCDQFHNEVKLLAIAATCLKNAKKYSDAAKLFEKLGQNEKARRGFLKSKNLDGLANLKEKEGDYSGAVQVFIDNNRIIDALKRAAAYESEGISLHESVHVDRMAISFAKVYIKQKKDKRLTSVLEFVREISLRIEFLKDAYMYSKACELHIQERQFWKAYRIFSAQAMYSEGIKLAEKQKDLKMQTKFVFQAAVACIGSSAGSMTDQHVLNKLKELRNCKRVNSKAQACLLLGKLTSNAEFCRQALKTYKEAKNAIGETESFNALVELSKINPENREFISMAVSACKAAKTVINATEDQQRPTPTNHFCMNHVIDFYCLEKHHNVYTIPSNQDIWVRSLITKDSSDLDPDGMIKIDIPIALNKVKCHMEQYILKWTERDLKVELVLQTRIHSFPFHKQMLEKGGHLQESFLTYTPGRLTEYLRACFEALEFHTATSKYFSKVEFQTVFLNFFSPQATVYLPVNETHCTTVRDLKAASNLLSCMAADRIARKEFKLDNWLDIWRIHCILGRGSQKLEQILAEQARQVNVKAEKSRQHDRKQIPYTFVYNRADQKYAHVFSMWLQACSLVHKEWNPKIIISSRIIVELFIQIIARRPSLRPTISVINLVNVACIFSTALLAIISQCYQLLHQNSTIAVPNTYLHIVKFFDCLTCQTSSDTRLLNVCVEEVKRSERANTLSKLKQGALELLQKILDVLVGKFNDHCNVLQYALKRRDTLENGEAHHCLILTLTLFGNLIYGAEFSREQVAEYQRFIFVSLQPLSRIPSSQASPAVQHLQRANTVLVSANNAAEVFHAVNHLMSVSDRGAHFVRFRLNRRDEKTLETPRVLMQEIPVLPLSPQIPLSQHLQFPAAVATQPTQFSPNVTPYAAIAMPAQDQMMPPQQHFSYASAASPQYEHAMYMWNNPELLNVTPSFPASATHVGSDLSSSNGKLEFQENQTVAVSESFSTNTRPEGTKPLGENVHNQSEGEPLAAYQLFSSSSGVKVSETSTTPQFSRETSYTEMDETEPEDPEADAPAMDEELQAALASTVDIDKGGIQESVIQETDDQMWFLVDDGVCKICAIPLSSSVSAEIEHEAVDETSEAIRKEVVAETRETHIRREVVAETRETHIRREVVAETRETHIRREVVAETRETHIRREVVAETRETHIRREVVAETRETHIKSKDHKEMWQQYKNFSENEQLYNQYKDSLFMELKECQRFSDPPPTLEILTNKIQQEINSTDQKVEDYKRSCEWREGASEIEDVMIDAMHSLLQQAKKERQKAITDQDKLKEPSMKHQQVGMQQSIADDDLADEFDKEEVIEYSASVVEEEKQKERKKKQSRRKKRTNKHI